MVTPYAPPAYAFGGPVAMAETMAAEFLRAGHSVTIATTDVLDERRRVPPGTHAQPPGVVYRRFPNASHRLAVSTSGWTPRGFRRWIRPTAAEFDLLHLHDVYSVLSVSAARSAVAARVPYALQPFGSLAPSAERGKPLVKRAFLGLWGRRTLVGAAALIHSTDDERADMVAAGAPVERLLRLPLPLELPPDPGARPARAEVPTVVHVGRLDPIKGIDVLLDAMAIVRRSEPRVRLELVGPGNGHRRGLEARARALGLEDAVAFRGFVSTDEKVATLRHAHAFCLLSRSEGLPVAALEAMACGTPVVLSRGCHLPEVEGRAGAVVDRDPQAAAAALIALLHDPARRERLGEGARDLAAGFRREVVMPRMIAAFAALARGDVPPGGQTPSVPTTAAEPDA